jgi:hypothetical protein
LFASRPETGCLGDLGLGGGDVAKFQHREPELQPCPRIIRVAGEVVAQVDHRRTVFAAGQLLLGACEKLLAARRAGRKRPQQAREQDGWQSCGTGPGGADHAEARGYSQYLMFSLPPRAPER